MGTTPTTELDVDELGFPVVVVEATAVLAPLLQSARFDWDGKHLPEPVSRVTLHPRGGMPLKVSML